MCCEYVSNNGVRVITFECGYCHTDLVAKVSHYDWNKLDVSDLPCPPSKTNQNYIFSEYMGQNHPSIVEYMNPNLIPDIYTQASIRDANTFTKFSQHENKIHVYNI